MTRASFPSADADWLDVGHALDRILANAVPQPPSDLPISEALGHVMAEDVLAPVSLPPWDNAGMDGYALRSRDLEPFTGDGVVFAVQGEVRAGEPQADTPPPGTAVRIMTGAPVPRGLDTVVRVEDTDAESESPGHVRVLRDRDRGRNVRRGGEDMRAGDRVLRAGQVVTPGRVALLAATGNDPVSVIARPHVVLLPTGDELRPAGDFAEVEAGEAIPESNGPTLAAACRAIGVPSTLLPPVPDDAEALAEAVSRAIEDGDVLLTLGGASMGTADLVKDVLGSFGFELDFWRVKMRPGSPFSFGRIPRAERRPLTVFGLPGNPASAFVTFQVLVRPHLLSVAGHRDLHRPVVDAIAAEPMKSHPERALFLRVMLEVDDTGGLHATLTGSQGSGLVSSLGRAHGLAFVPPGPACPAGSPIKVLLLDDGPAGVEEPGYTETPA